MSLDHIDATLRRAGRALARHGLVHAYGHCSLRIDAGTFRVSPSKPLGLVGDEDGGTTVALHGPLPDGVLGEVRIHREIYRLRADVGAVVRCTPPRVMSLSAGLRTPRARHGFGSYFYPEPPLWRDPQLLRDDARARQLAEQLGDARAIVMRGNGAVLVGESIEQAVVLAWYLEDAARVELDALAIGFGEESVLSASDAAARAIFSGRIVERMWDYLTHGADEVLRGRDSV